MFGYIFVENWLRKFGVAGRDAAKTIGLIATEEYELTAVNGLIVHVKNSRGKNLSLFQQTEEYFKHNKSGKKPQIKPVVKTGPDKIVDTTLKQEIIQEVNQSSVAIFKDGYYEVNGFKFTEYYYNRLWSKGRPAPSLVAKEILDGAKTCTIDERFGFFNYRFGGWEMVYNPITKEIWHIQPL